MQKKFVFVNAFKFCKKNNLYTEPVEKYGFATCNIIPGQHCNSRLCPIKNMVNDWVETIPEEDL